MSATDNPYFQIELSKVHRDRAVMSDWFAFEPHAMLWTARSRVRQMYIDRPELVGHVRICSVNPLSILVVDSLTD